MSNGKPVKYPHVGEEIPKVGKITKIITHAPCPNRFPSITSATVQVTDLKGRSRQRKYLVTWVTD